MPRFNAAAAPKRDRSHMSTAAVPERDEVVKLDFAHTEPHLCGTRTCTYVSPKEKTTAPYGIYHRILQLEFMSRAWEGRMHVISRVADAGVEYCIIK